MEDPLMKLYEFLQPHYWWLLPSAVGVMLFGFFVQLAATLYVLFCEEEE